MDKLTELPEKNLRIAGTKYIYKDKVVIWNGKIILCEHGRRRSQCKECGGASICEHGRRRSECKDCGGASICEHGRNRSYCKECGGSSICEHGRNRSQCKECGGSCICEHGRRRSQCKECGGSCICEHGRERSQCKECGGASICEHGRIRSQCKECDPNGYLTKLLRCRVYSALKTYSKRRDKKHTLEYVGCSLETLRTHIERQFTEGMNWDNQGEWHIDHIKPCASFNLDNEDERHQCFHYTNLQPLWGPDNLSKSDNYDSDDDDRMWNGEEWM